MTYNDCVHFLVCDRCPNCKPSECKHFKNKADFFEIVRCENCKHGDKLIVSKDINSVEKEAVYCLAKNTFTSCDGWCSCGERSDT